jgi:hypothetical protein
MTDTERIANCQARVTNEIARVTASNMIAEQKTRMLQALNERKAGCLTHPPIGKPNPNPNTPLTQAQKIAACQARVTSKIARSNTNTTMPAEQKAAMIQRLNTRLASCSTKPNPPDGDETPGQGLGLGLGRGSVSRPYKQNQVIEGKLDAITQLLQQIFDFIKSILNPIPAPAPTA